MASEIRICNFFRLTTAKGALHRYQNYFIGETKVFQGQSYAFSPFQADGALASLNGDNQQLRVLFPSQELVIRLVEDGDGNRLSVLALTTAWLNAAGDISTFYPDFFIGTGATFNDDTVELRFRSSMDSVGAAFPARTFTSNNVGILPLNAELYLR
jgi:phage-related protein